jgi:hypothetical protein
VSWCFFACIFVSTAAPLLIEDLPEPIPMYIMIGTCSLAVLVSIVIRTDEDMDDVSETDSNTDDRTAYTEAFTEKDEIFLVKKMVAK